MKYTNNWSRQVMRHFAVRSFLPLGHQRDLLGASPLKMSTTAKTAIPKIISGGNKVRFPPKCLIIEFCYLRISTSLKCTGT